MDAHHKHIFEIAQICEELLNRYLIDVKEEVLS